MSYQNESFKNNSRIEAQPSQDLGLEYSGHKEQLKNTNVVEVFIEKYYFKAKKLTNKWWINSK